MSRRIIRGLSIINAASDVKRKQKGELTRDPDVVNREELVKRIHKFMESGKSLDEAVELIMQDDIMEKFDYWYKNGLDVRQCIKNLVRSYTHIKQTKGQER